MRAFLTRVLDCAIDGFRFHVWALDLENLARDHARDHARARALDFALDRDLGLVPAFLRVLISVRSFISHKPSGGTRSSQDRAPSRKTYVESGVLKLLKTFAWFCGQKNREHIECTLADLTKDRRGMRKEGRSRSFIVAVLLWHVIGTILSILRDGIFRLLNAILPVGKLVAKIKGW